MKLTPRVRKLTLAVHITVSVGWIGALAAYLGLDVASVTSDDPQMLRAVYLAMELVARSVIVPLALGALSTGLIISLGTKWGLFQHYWVLISLVLTTLATVVLLSETRTISTLAELAASPSTSDDSLRSLGSTLVHSIGGTLVLLAVLALNVYKPRGLTRYGWRKQAERREQREPAGE